MSPNELRAKLHGVIGFPVTPFKADLSLDLEGYRRNLRAMLAHPPAAIVAAGGTGELYSLSPAEHLAVVRAAVEEAQGAVPVIAGAGFNGPIARELAQQAAGAGASGILAFPPYYPGGEDEGLLQYYQAIGSATGLGLLIYSRDWFHPSAALVERLAGIPTLIAWKDGQGDIRRLQILRVAGRRPPALDRRRRRRSRAGVLSASASARSRRASPMSARRSRASCTRPPRAATPPHSQR